MCTTTRARNHSSKRYPVIVYRRTRSFEVWKSHDLWIRTLSLLASYAFSLSSTQKWSAQPRVRVLYNSACQLADRIRSDTVEWTSVTGGQTDRIIHGGRYTALVCIMRLSRAIKMCPASSCRVQRWFVACTETESREFTASAENRAARKSKPLLFHDLLSGFLDSLTLGPNFITSIVCGFACCTACYTTNPQQILKKSTTGPQQIEFLQQIRKKFTTNPQQFDKSTTSLQHVYDKSTTNRSSGVWALTSWSLNCRRQNSLSRCTPSVLYTEVDARCDKLATVVGRTELTTLATVDGCDVVRSV